MNKNLKIITLIVLILIGIFGFYKLIKLISPGSYPYAEIYELNFPEKKVIDAINKFKKLHPEMIVPKVTVEGRGSFDMTESEGRKENSHWYFIYFYYQKENQIVSTWTRSSQKESTSFAFVALNNGLNIGNWKDINNDFNSSENQQLKKDFEKRILEPVINILKDE
jgi:hypothetical protein